MSKIFNPLDHLQSLEQNITAAHASAEVDQEHQVATAAIYNEVVGICPKCHQSMSTSKIANADSVFFCPKDRVVLPLPDAASI